MPVDQMRCNLNGINVAPRIKIAKPIRHRSHTGKSVVPVLKAPTNEERVVQRLAKQIARNLAKPLDGMEVRLTQHVDAAADRAQTYIIERLDKKDQADLQRIEAMKVGWSKFILKRCLESCLNILVRNLPLIVSMVLSVSIASGVAAGPIGLAASLGPVVVVALLVLAWEAYKAFKEYRTLRADERTKPATCDANADDTKPVQSPPGANPAVGAPRPSAPSLTWRQQCADFTRFVIRRGIP